MYLVEAKAMGQMGAEDGAAWGDSKFLSSQFSVLSPNRMREGPKCGFRKSAQGQGQLAAGEMAR